jgi:hypothetical protein
MKDVETLKEAFQKALAGDDDALCMLLDIILPDLTLDVSENK